MVNDEASANTSVWSVPSNFTDKPIIRKPTAEGSGESFVKVCSFSTYHSFALLVFFMKQFKF